MLVAAVDQDMRQLLKALNIQTSAIIANQCDSNCFQDLIYDAHKIQVLNFQERGVGLNRNNALMRANAQYCLFADDDMAYVDGYESIVVSAFEQHPDADVVVFNLHEKESNRYIIKNCLKVSWHNFMRFGAARIAIRLSSIREAGILFNLCYGGGCEYSHGEDTIFLADCLKKRLRIYAVPDFIATLDNNRPSTWNKGYTRKYLRDQGRLYHTIFPIVWKLVALQDAVRHHRRYGIRAVEAFRTMISFNR